MYEEKEATWLPNYAKAGDSGSGMDGAARFPRHFNYRKVSFHTRLSHSQLPCSILFKFTFHRRSSNVGAAICFTFTSLLKCSLLLPRGCLPSERSPRELYENVFSGVSFYLFVVFPVVLSRYPRISPVTLSTDYI